MALFFYNPNAGLNITVLWKPITQTSQEFRVSLKLIEIIVYVSIQLFYFHFQLTAVDGQKLGDDGQLQFDFQQIINDFHVIGHGLVEDITNHRSK